MENHHREDHDYEHMIEMSINVSRVMLIEKMVHAGVDVQVPGLSAHAVISVSFPGPVGSNREDWEDIAYDKALLMLDPA